MSFRVLRGVFALTVWAVVSPVSTVFAGEPRQVVGSVIATEGASLDGTAIRAEDTVFSGNRLNTTGRSEAQVSVGSASRVDVQPGSSVRLEHGNQESVRAHLSYGTLLTATEAHNLIVVEAQSFRIEPAERKATTFLVAVLPNNKTVVEARRGGVSILEVGSGKKFLLAEGLFAVIPAGSGIPGQEKEESKEAPSKPAGQESAPKPSEAPPPAAGQQPWHIGSLSHNASIGVVVGAVGGGAAVAAAVASSGGGGGGVVSPVAP